MPDMQFDFLQSLILLLIGLLFFRETLLTWIGRKMGFKSMIDKHHSGEQVPDWAAELQQHFNHDTTELLREIRDSQKSMCHKVDKVVTLLENQREYGVKILK